MTRRNFFSMAGLAIGAVATPTVAVGIAVATTPKPALPQITLRREKGIPITAAELDDNFAALRLVIERMS